MIHQLTWDINFHEEDGPRTIWIRIRGGDGFQFTTSMYSSYTIENGRIKQQCGSEEEIQKRSAIWPSEPPITYIDRIDILNRWGVSVCKWTRTERGLERNPCWI